MNRILDLIGNHLRVVSLVLLGGFLAAAAAGYWGVPGLTRNPPHRGAAAQTGSCSHDEVTPSAKAGAGHGCAYDQASARDSCCPQLSTRPQPTTAHCPALSQAAEADREFQPETGSHAH